METTAADLEKLNNNNNNLSYFNFSFYKIVFWLLLLFVPLPQNLQAPKKKKKNYFTHDLAKRISEMVQLSSSWRSLIQLQLDVS